MDTNTDIRDTAMQPVEEAIKSIGQKVADVEVRIGPQFLNLFSKQLYSSPNKAFEELISNSWDADAHNVYVQIPDDLNNESSIWILDDGVAMNVSGFEDLWSVAASKKRDASIHTQRKPIGKFGVGKLATYLLANELTYICKASDGIIRIITMDYRDIDSRGGDQLHIEPVPLAVRILSGTELKDFVSRISGGNELLSLLNAGVPSITSEEFEDEFGGERIKPIPKSGTWTLAILSSLKNEGLSIQSGWIKQLLRTALPLGDSIRINVNGDTIRPKKSTVPVLHDWVIGPGLGIKSVQLGEDDETYEVVEHGQPYPNVEIVGVGKVSGKVKLLTCHCEFPPEWIRVRPIKGRTHEEAAIYGRADYCGVEGAGGWREGGRPLPQAWNFRSNVLQLESQIRRHGGL